MTEPEPTQPRPPPQHLSGASLGLVSLPDDDPADEVGFELSTQRRYRDAGVLGRGGMGEIRVTFDRRLGRDVAIKTPVLRNPAARRQFVAEAKLTAKLVHPGIVAVHDAGLLPDGQPYYTMPIIEGRTLAEALVASTAEGRLRLVRHFLHACEAVGYAHSERIVHRDLKPANILVGRFGETIVVDWGLAGSIGVRPPGVAGTPSYMAPEQKRGNAIDARADVFALGVTLREIVTGSNVAGAATGAPELLAIVERATSEDPDARYADGHALAEDVAAWFEGRRVAAHRYGMLELVARAWSAHRVPLVATLVALVGIAIAAAIGYTRTAAERGRAQESEKMAMAARARAEHSLAQAEVAQAKGAMARSDWAQAELYAAGALTHGPSAQARGVLARFDGAARPRLVRRVELPDCTHAVLSADGWTIACARTDGTVLGRVEGAWTPLETLADRGTPVAVTDAGPTVVMRGSRAHVTAIDPRAPDRLLELSPPGANPHRFHSHGRWVSWVSGTAELWADLDTGSVELTQSCLGRGNRVPAVVGRRPDGARILVCQDGAVLVSAPDGASTSEALRLPADLGGPLVLAFERTSTRRAALATANGEAVVIDFEAGRVLQSFASHSGTPSDIALAEGRLAVADGSGHVDVWEIATGALAVRLSTNGTRVRWLDDGTSLRVVGGAIEDFALARARSRTHLHHSPSGVAAVSLSSDGRHMVSAHGDGALRLSRVDGVHSIAELPLHWSVAKDTEFSPDGRRFVAVSAQGDELQIFDLDDPLLPERWPASAGPRVAWLLGDVVVLARYQDGLEVWRRGKLVRDPRLEHIGRIVDLESDADRRAVTALTDAGEIVRLSESLEPTFVTQREDAVAVAGSASAIAVLRDGALEVIDGDGTTREVPLPTTSADLALSPDGRLLAVAHTNGTASLWSTTSLDQLAVLEAHAGHVASVAFDARSEWLVTGGWDGDVRQWSMHGLVRPADGLLAEIEAHWGRTIDGLLAETSGLGGPAAPKPQGL